MNKKPYVRNCTFVGSGDSSGIEVFASGKNTIFNGLFVEDDDGIHPFLDGYTILPNEDYEKLVRNQKEV